MSQERLLIWWIDDEPDRLKASARRRIEKPIRRSDTTNNIVKLEVKQLKDEKERVAIEQELASRRKAKTLPQLLIVDQILNRSDGIVRKGSSFAVALRAEAPEVPAVGVTAASFDDIAELQKDQFIELFNIDDLQSGKRIPDLLAIAGGFQSLTQIASLKETSEERRKRLLHLLGCPEDDVEMLSVCIPGEFLGTWDDETAHVFSRWIWHTFIGRAGFLNDDLEIATLLGVNLTGLAVLLPRLTQCQYGGIFSATSRRRWWVSKVRRTVRETTKSAPTEPLWRLGRQMLSSRANRYLSKCHGASDSPCVPDVIAFEDGRLRERVQARMEDTEILEIDTTPIGFEPYRVFKGTGHGETTS